MPKKNKNDNTPENEDDDEEYRDAEDKWEGFHFTRLTCISFLTLIIMIVALILDNLSVWGKQRTCTFLECSQGTCTNCQGTSGCGGDYCNYDSCEANGVCGWRTGRTKWVKEEGATFCPGCSDSTYCVDGDDENWTSEFNFGDLCRNHEVDDGDNDDKDDDACMAVDGGNVYIAFTIFAIIFNLFTLCLIAPRMILSITYICCCINAKSQHAKSQIYYNTQYIVEINQYFHVIFAMKRLIYF